ncbi:MAG TPA: fumarate hydratase [Gemmatimonadaceae bacterium]
MTTISQEDLIRSVADSLQFISYYHPADYIAALGAAYEAEESPAAKDAIAQILTNSRMSAEGHRPICQDTGIVVAFVRVGMDVRLADATMSVADMINEGVRRAYLHPDNTLRASILRDPAGKRVNTRDNTPAVVHFDLVPGNTVDVRIAAKGGGSENKAKFTMLNPSDSIVDWVVKTVPTMGAGWCPPGMLGIGAQGLGGLSTVLDVKILDYPTHAASLPVAIIPNCAATRHAHFTLDGSGAARLEPPDLATWPKVKWSPAPESKRVDVNALTPAEVASWKPGDRLLLNGKILTGRDAAHKRIVDMLARGEPLPVNFRNRIIYYVGPVDPVRDEVVGPAGPTTATRMDKFTETMLARTGLIAMIGKAERGPVAIDAIRRHRAAYLMAVGGAAYLVSKAIRNSRVLAFEDLGMEAIYEFDVVDMPVTVAVDSTGESVHETGPREWQRRIGKIPVAVV